MDTGTYRDRNTWTLGHIWIGTHGHGDIIIRIGTHGHIGIGTQGHIGIGTHGHKDIER